MKKLNENTIRVKQMMRKVDEMLDEAIFFGKLPTTAWEEIANDKAKYDRMRSIGSTGSAEGLAPKKLDMKIMGTGKWGDILRLPEDPDGSFPEWPETDLWDYNHGQKFTVNAKYDEDRKFIIIDTWKRLPKMVHIKFETQQDTKFKLDGQQTEFCFFWKRKKNIKWEEVDCGVDFAIWEMGK